MKHFLLPTIVILPDGKDFLLLRPETGMLLHLNPSGAWLCGKLMQGMERTELPRLLQAAGAPETALFEAEAFWNMLQKKELLTNEKGEGRLSAEELRHREKKQEIPPAAEVWENGSLYDFEGMQGEFSGREALRLATISPEEFSPGDVVLYDAGKKGCAGKVRRVIGRTKDFLTVSGDARGSSVEKIPLPASCQLVTEKLFPGNLRRPVARKGVGRVRHCFFCLASRLIGPAEKAVTVCRPLMFWRIPLELKVFPPEWWFCFRWKRIALMTHEGYFYRSFWYRLLFRIPPHLFQEKVLQKEFSRK